jgi:TrmH family RNA methyltransferase
MALTKNQRRDLHALSQRRFRDETDLFLVEGARLVREAVGSAFDIAEVYHTAAFGATPEGAKLLDALRRRSTLITVTEKELEGFSDTVHAQGVAAVLLQRHDTPSTLMKQTEGASALVAVDAMADPGNLGSIIRTCDWFGVDGLLIGRNSVDLYNPKVVRSTMGGLFHLPIVQEVDLPVALTRAKELGYTVYATDAGGPAHFDRVAYASKSVVVFGNEAWGISDAVSGSADVRVSIRKYGSAESLNVGVACGIVLSAMRKLKE